MAKFVEFTTVSGKKVWVNPERVQIVRPGERKGAWIDFETGGDGRTVHVEDLPAEAVARLEA